MHNAFKYIGRHRKDGVLLIPPTKPLRLIREELSSTLKDLRAGLIIK